jgi:hypothetical protein
MSETDCRMCVCAEDLQSRVPTGGKRESGVNPGVIAGVIAVVAAVVLLAAATVVYRLRAHSHRIQQRVRVSPAMALSLCV